MESEERRGWEIFLKCPNPTISPTPPPCPALSPGVTSRASRNIPGMGCPRALGAVLAVTALPGIGFSQNPPEAVPSPPSVSHIRFFSCSTALSPWKTIPLSFGFASQAIELSKITQTPEMKPQNLSSPQPSSNTLKRLLQRFPVA